MIFKRILLVKKVRAIVNRLMMRTMSRLAGQFSILPTLTTTSTGAQFQLASTPSSTSVDQVVTLPVLLNSSGEYQIMQQPTPSSQSIVVNASGGNPEGTIFLTSDGRLFDPSGVMLQNAQQLKTNSLGQGVTVQQAGTHEVVNSVRPLNDIPSDVGACPVHGQRVETSESHARAIQIVGAPQAVSVNTSVTQSSVTQINSNQNPGGGGHENEVVQLLATMVDPDLGSLFCSSPKKSISESPPSSEGPSKEAGSKKRRARSNGTPRSEMASKTVNNINQDNKLQGGQGLGQSAHLSRSSMTTMQPDQTANGNRNIFSTMGCINSEQLIVSPGHNAAILVPQVLSTPLETTKSPPGNPSKPRKQIKFKGPVLSRTLDVGGTPETQPRQKRNTKGNMDANADVQSTKIQSKGHNKTGSPDPVSKKNATLGITQSTNPSKPANQLATHNKSAPSDFTRVPSDMSAEVNIAAQMLVCLSNSPPSLRQSPYRQQRLRNNSGRSPTKSPSRDWVMELRKEIGLTPNSRRSQQKDHTNPTEESRPSKQQSEAQKDVKSSKRKSKTPRKQANTTTETVVMTLPSESQHKSKTPMPTSVQTRASLQKAKSPGKVADDTVANRKSSRSTKSSRKSGIGDGDSAGALTEKGDNLVEDTGKKENRGQKRSRESNTKEEVCKYCL